MQQSKTIAQQGSFNSGKTRVARFMLRAFIEQAGKETVAQIPSDQLHDKFFDFLDASGFTELIASEMVRNYTRIIGD